MNKKQLFKISGTVDSKKFGRSETIRFEGYFVKRAKKEIVGINKENGKEFFIKGLFINNEQLIFVEIAAKGAKKRGYAFNNIKDTGRYDLYDWLSGLFSGEGDEMPAKIQIKRCWEAKKAKRIERSFEEFYESLYDYDKWIFDETNQLEDYLH